ncbi:L-threonine kinase [Clostridium homopropionicum DSM 5847]|uniref:L-threonine kinase n=1 Tax=Clostridium homopropionicum DSM 5847 TaxID=1121318 RepID=A0A0L6ZAF8_9CLOT|nr:kinase [Clostridium homopropionicum]KOA19758.1 L-threonine kinase [Clostridium homopropionicum DSM 5847]SFF78157.1 threonine kinase [Clostridium homopropionicum]
MEVITRYPGSFGEVLQGKVNNKDMLLSCPINIYTTVRLFECREPNKKSKCIKTDKFLYNLLRSWNYEEYYESLDLEIYSNIPSGKGMASSTADLCATYYALLKMFKKNFSEEELIKLCISIEPTDSIIFREMTLFDYKKGTYREKIGNYISYNILAFEGEKSINTIEFNNKKLPELSDATDLFTVLKEGLSEKNLEKLSYVSEESIKRNQNRLSYSWIKNIENIKKCTSGLGITGAHSGNALGIIYEDEEKLKAAVKFINKQSFYKVYAVKTLEKIEQV